MARFYSDFFTSINGQLEGTISSTASAVIGAITPVATTLLLIYVALWAWSMARGMISEPVTDGATRIVYLSIILAIALSIGYYNGFLSDWLWRSPDAMAGIIAPGRDPQGNMGFLDGLMLRYDRYASAWFKAAEENPWMGGAIPDLWYYAIGGAVLLAGVLLTGYAAALLVLAKIMLAVLLGIGPMFVLALVFQVSRRFFETWLGQCLNFVFVVILISALFAIVGLIISRVLSTEMSAINTASVPDISAAIGIIALSAIIFILLLQIPGVASALGGGVAVSTLGAVGVAWHKMRGATLAGIRGGRWAGNEAVGRNRADRRFQKLRRAETNQRWDKYREERRVTRTNTVKQA